MANIIDRAHINLSFNRIDTTINSSDCVNTIQTLYIYSSEHKNQNSVKKSLNVK